MTHNILQTFSKEPITKTVLDDCSDLRFEASMFYIRFDEING
jgi:hypothetical protein